MPDLSFEEKSVWGSFIAVALFSGMYFVDVFGMILGPEPIDAARAGRVGISLLVTLIVVEIVYHAVIAAWGGSSETDERDRLIEIRASRNGYVALAAAGFVLVVHLMAGAMLQTPRYEDLVTPFVVANMLLLAMVAAELVKYASQIVSSRGSYASALRPPAAPVNESTSTFS